MAYDRSQFLQVLSRLAQTFHAPHTIDDVLDELAVGLTGALGLVGAGASLVRDGRLEFAAGFPSLFVELEKTQQEHQSGPCVSAFMTDHVVPVSDLTSEQDRWPTYCAVAERVGVVAVAGVPLRVKGECLGALDLYADRPRAWADEDLAAAVALAEIAGIELATPPQRQREEDLKQQLQAALDSRLVIEQAKGIVANKNGITVEAAYQLIRRHARSHNVTVRDVSGAIVNVGLQP